MRFPRDCYYRGKNAHIWHSFTRINDKSNFVVKLDVYHVDSSIGLLVGGTTIIFSSAPGVLRILNRLSSSICFGGETCPRSKMRMYKRLAQALRVILFNWKPLQKLFETPILQEIVQFLFDSCSIAVNFDHPHSKPGTVECRLCGSVLCLVWSQRLTYHST